MRVSFARVILLILLVSGVAAVVAGRSSLEEIPFRIAALGAWAPVAYVVLYAALGSVFFPASILTLTAGAVFGLGLGTAVCSLGSTLAAALSFLVGRYLARDWVEAKMAGSRRFSVIDRAVAREGWRMVVLTRLSPVFPYGLLNYGFGITGVKFWPYVVASWIAMLPGTVLYVFIGTLGRSLVRVGEHGPWQWAFYVGGLLATLLVVLLVTRVARRAMREIFGQDKDASPEPGHS